MNDNEVKRVCNAVLRLRGLKYHMRVVFFYESAEKVLSYARLNCAVFNYFYTCMSLGQVRHTIDSTIEI